MTPRTTVIFVPAACPSGTVGKNLADALALRGREAVLVASGGENSAPLLPSFATLLPPDEAMLTLRNEPKRFRIVKAEESEIDRDDCIAFRVVESAKTLRLIHPSGMLPGIKCPTLFDPHALTAERLGEGVDAALDRICDHLCYGSPLHPPPSTGPGQGSSSSSIRILLLRERPVAAPGDYMTRPLSRLRRPKLRITPLRRDDPREWLAAARSSAEELLLLLDESLVPDESRLDEACRAIRPDSNGVVAEGPEGPELRAEGRLLPLLLLKRGPMIEFLERFVASEESGQRELLASLLRSGRIESLPRAGRVRFGEPGVPETSFADAARLLL